MNEAKFAAWFRKNLILEGAMTQRIETTTGRGVPDLMILFRGQIRLVELKWKTHIIRPEQCVWAFRAREAGVFTAFLCGWEREANLFLDPEFVRMSKGWKLDGDPSLVFRRNPEGVRKCVDALFGQT